MLEPCSNVVGPLTALNTMLNGLAGILTIYLVHRRKMADKRREDFERSIKRQLGMSTDEPLGERNGTE